MKAEKEIGPGLRRYWVYVGPVRVRVWHRLWLRLGGSRLEAPR